MWLPSAPGADTVPQGVAGSTIIANAAKYLGDAYDYGATGPTSWDCSALVQEAYRESGIQLPRTTFDQVKMPGVQTVGKDQLQPGDLVFSDWGDGPDSHVAMYAGNGQLLEAGTSGVAYTPFSDSYQGHVNDYRRVPGIQGYDGTAAPSSTGSNLGSSALGFTGGSGGGSGSGVPSWVQSVPVVGGIVNAFAGNDPISYIANGVGSIANDASKVGALAQPALDIALHPARATLKITLFFMGLILIILGVWMVASEIRD